MKILGKEINNEDKYEKLWNIFKKVNEISSIILGVIGALWTLGIFISFIEKGISGTFIYSLSPFLTGVLNVLIPFFSLLLLLFIPKHILRRKARDTEQNILYTILLIISSIIFIFSLLGLLGIFAFSTLNSFLGDLGVVITLSFFLLIFALSSLCMFTSIIWFIIFHNNWEEHCKKVEQNKKKKIARLEKQNADKKKETEIKTESKLLEKLNLKKKKIQELKDLCEENLISKKEYEEMRKKIIERED